MNSFKFWSFICFISCVLLWVPNVVFQVASPFWLATYIVGPIGIALALMRRHFLLVMLNVLGTCSFFILMFLGYWWNSF